MRARRKPDIYRCVELWCLSIVLVLMLSSCAGDVGDLAQETLDQLQISQSLGSWLLAFGIVVAVFILLVLPLTKLSSGETVAGISIILLLAFYYAQPISKWIAGLVGPDASELVIFLQEPLSVLAGFILKIQTFVITHLPQKSISIGDISVIQMEGRRGWDTTLIPIYFVIAGALARVAVERYVRNDKLRKFTGEYWLYIVTYLVLAYVISAIYDLNFFTVMTVFVLIFVALALGLLEVIRDILSGLAHVLVLAWRFVRIGIKGLVSMITVLTEFVKQIGARIKLLYRKYVVIPVQHAYASVNTFLDEIDEKLDSILGREPH